MADTGAGLVFVKGRAAATGAAAKTGVGRLRLSGDLGRQLGDSLPARAVEVGGTVRLNAAIARTAPPGSHKATLVIDGDETPVTIEVAERRRLRFRPSAVHISGRPGGKASASVIIENAGNVAMEIPEGGISGLFASDGLAGAFASAYGIKSDDHQEIFGAFVHGLRRGFLGLMKLSFDAGKDTTLNPGDVRTITANFTLPRAGDDSQTGAGRRFHATFSFEGARLVTRLTLAAPANPSKGAST